MDNFSKQAWTDLEEVAFIYGTLCANLKSAKDCNMPLDFIQSLEKAVADQLDDLKKAALEHYDNVYDGSDES